MSLNTSAVSFCLIVTLCSSVVRAEIPGEASAAFDQQRWEDTINILKPLQRDSDAERLLALAYYRSQDIDAALPAIRSALEDSPGDPELTKALFEILIADRLYSEAETVNAALEASGAEMEAKYGRARIAAAQSENTLATGLLNELVDTAEPELAQQSASLLIELLIADDEAGRAFEVAQRAIARDPDSFFSFRFSKLQPVDDSSRRLRYVLGYRMEYDDNVALLPDNSGGIFGSSGEEDFRHVLTGDILYRKSFAGNWSFFAEGHLSQSFHHDLDQFDLTSANAVVGIGQSNERWGWRLPLEVTNDRFDGDDFRTSLRASPGVYMKIASKLFLHVYGRIEDEDYETFQGPTDSRNGDVRGGGVLVAGTITPRFSIRSFVEIADYDTDGSNWQRDELTAYVYGEISFGDDWLVGLAVRYRDIEYDKVRTPFLQKQADDSQEVYINVARSFRQNWQFRSQVSIINHDSNVAVFNHDRNVYSISISREF